MKLKKIVFLTTQFTRGGAETQVLRLAIELRRKGYEIVVVSMLPAMDLVDELKQSDITYHCLEMNRGQARPKDLYTLVRLLHELEPDVLACFCFHANVMGSIAGRLARVPVVVTSIRNAWFGSRLREWAERLISSAQMSDRTITNSKLVADDLIRRGVVAPGRIGVIYNGIYCEEYKNNTTDSKQTRSELGVKPDNFLWLAVGNVRNEKDYPNLLRAFAKIKQRQPTAQLRVAGGLWFDEVTTEVQELMEKHELQNHVQFLGQRSDIPALLQAADGFVLSSRTEGLPNVVMEALVSSLPVVATDVGGVRELVADGVTGFVVPSLDAKSLANAMIRMIELPVQKRAEMGAAGQKHIADNFELKIICEQWEALFLEHLKAKHSV